MIHYVVTARHDFTVKRLLEARRGCLPVEVVPLTYEALLAGHWLPATTFIFTDFDWLTVQTLQRAAAAWRTLRASGRRLRLLNHPLLAMQRYELLREMFERGINDFNVYRLTEARRPARYPVFLRSEKEHYGVDTGLIGSPAELDAAIAGLVEAGRSREALIAVEFHAVPDSRGYYRKYGAFYVAGRVIPRSVEFSRSWIVKRNEIEPDDVMLAIEYEYLVTNPHRELLRQVFEAARIDFGRVDYGIVDGRVQIYEIHTNPGLLWEGDAVHARGRPDFQRATDRLLEALAACDALPEQPQGSLRTIEDARE